MQRTVVMLIVTTASALAGRAAVAVDTVVLKSSDKRVAGEITSATRTEVRVEPRIGSPTTVPANDILYIDWDAQPPALGLARSKMNAGQYEAALADYETAREGAAAGNENVRAEIDYGTATAIARLSLADASRREEALTRLKAFLDAHPDHYRNYDAQMMLGEVHLAAGDGIPAESAFTRVADAPWPDYQMAAKVAIGRVLFARGDVSGARAAFDEVAGMNASSPAEQSRKFEAMLGQAKCLQQLSQHEQAAKILGEVIQQCDADDTRLQAEAYVRQGDCYVAQGNRTREAVMAYLHVDVIPSLAREKDLHAEALYQLTQLWPVLGQPARAAEAASELESNYPNSEWTQKLGGG